MQNTDTIQVGATPEEMLHPGNLALFRYWKTICGEMSAPPRDWLDLKKIHRLVPFAFMMERKLGKSYVWRLAGTQVCELWRMELTGRPVLAQGERFQRETLARLLDRVVDIHQPFVARFRLDYAKDASVAAELVGLPMQARNDDTTHVFGTMMAFRDVHPSRHDRVTGFELTAARGLTTGLAAGKRKVVAKIVQQGFRVINGGRAG
jgi:hypothetical protein